uniref:Queuine tRNA-ribosyltransferase catalytic subunit 1 n=1 Tax=Cacopsylla melanoneura TaxID=428564 RepID=A0A8D8RSH6_9HEMI
MSTSSSVKPLQFKILAECRTSNARTAVMCLPHFNVETPVFMPVGTKGSIKGVLNQQLETLNCQIILGNTYHLGIKPGIDVLEKAGGLHKFMGWNRALLTDSGGFQMVSLLKFAEIKEEGVKFQSTYGDGVELMLSPEHSTKIQNIIGADIMMQLDDVNPTTLTGPRVAEAKDRTVRWLDRCLAAHENPSTQNIFPIVQGGLDENLRKDCAQQLTERDVNGFAVGGLSGGEAKEDFWYNVLISVNNLPKEKPRYVMGIGFAVDLLICCALGADMFDCVFPTRTARFGSALVRQGQLQLRQSCYATDDRTIDKDCPCSTCKRYTRSYLHHIVTVEPSACHLLSVHNIAFQMRLMQEIRESIKSQTFPQYVKEYMKDAYPDENYPKWTVDALRAVNIDLIDCNPGR